MASHESSSINNDDPSVDESTPLLKEKMRQLNKVVNKIDKHASTDKSTIEQLAFVVADDLTSESERETIFKIFKSFCNKCDKPPNPPSLGAAVFRDALKSIGYGESAKERSHLNSLNEFCDNESELETREQYQKKFNFRAKLLEKGAKLDLSRPLNLREDQLDCDPKKIKHLTVLQLLDQFLHATTISLDKEEESLAFLDGLIEGQSVLEEESLAFLDGLTEAQCNAERSQFPCSCKQADRAKIKKASIPVGIISVVLVSFIFILIVAPTVLATQSPIVLTFNQSIRNSDTTPLILTADDHLPRYYHLAPYNNVTVELVNHLYNAEVVYVRGANACDLLPGHVTSEVVDPVPLPLSPSNPILIKGNQYYPQGSTLQGRLNITAGGNERGNFTLCLVRSQVTSEPQDLVCFRSANYSIMANKSIQLNYTISTPGYFDVYLMATASIEVDYQLNITYWYYNIQDYSNSILCRITSNNEFRSCTFLLNPEDIGCLIAHLDQEVSIPRYETFRVHLIRDMIDVYIALAICSVPVIFYAVVLVVALVYYRVLWYKGKFKTEIQQV